MSCNSCSRSLTCCRMPFLSSLLELMAVDVSVLLEEPIRRELLADLSDLAMASICLLVLVDDDKIVKSYWFSLSASSPESKDEIGTLIGFVVTASGGTCVACSCSWRMTWRRVRRLQLCRLRD